MGASTSSCAARFLKKILTMNILIFLVPLLVVINLAEAQTFAEQLAVFVNETPNGFTVSKMVKNGQNCHCRVPASSSSSSSSSGFFSSSSSSQLAPTTAGGSSVVTTAANGAVTGTTGSAAFDADTTATVAAISAAADYDTGAGSFAAEDTLPGSAAEDALPGSFRRR